MKKFLLLVFLLASPVWAQSPAPNVSSGFREYTVAARPTSGLYAGLVIVITDGSSASDCTTGGGSSRALCRYTGSAWESIGGGGGGGSGDVAGGSSLTTQGAFPVVSATPGTLAESLLTFDSTVKSLSIAQGTYTGASTNPSLNISRTWNNGSTVFTGLKLDITNTASAATSMLLNLSVGGSCVFCVAPTGAVSVTGSGAGALELTEGSAPSLVANRVTLYAAADVQANGLKLLLPSTAASGFLKGSNSSDVVTTSIAPLTLDKTISIWTGSTLADTDDFSGIWFNQLGVSITITSVCARTDTGASIINLQRDDGSAANILSSNLTSDTTVDGACTSSFSGSENIIANGEGLNFVMVTGASSGSPTKLTVVIVYTRTS